MNLLSNKLTLDDLKKNYVFVVDCFLYDFELSIRSRLPGVLCHYDLKNKRVLVAGDKILSLKKFDGEILWQKKLGQINHDITISPSGNLFYALDYEIRNIDGETVAGSVIKAFDLEGEKVLEWSGLNLYNELLQLQPYQKLLKENRIENEVRIDERSVDLAILINNIQFMETLPLNLPYKEKDRYLMLSFANLNHLAIFDMKEKKVVWRYHLFPNSNGAFFHTPQFLDNNKFIALTNFNFVDEKNDGKILYKKHSEKTYTDVCQFDLKKEGEVERCWLTQEQTLAEIMGSAFLYDDNLVISYCDRRSKCQLIVKGYKNEKTLWSSKALEEETGLPLISERHVYRAHVEKSQKFEGLSTWQ